MTYIVLSDYIHVHPLHLPLAVRLAGVGTMFELTTQSYPEGFIETA